MDEWNLKSRVSKETYRFDSDPGTSYSVKVKRLRRDFPCSGGGQRHKGRVREVSIGVPTPESMSVIACQQQLNGATAA